MDLTVANHKFNLDKKIIVSKARARKLGRKTFPRQMSLKGTKVKAKKEIKGNRKKL